MTTMIRLPQTIALALVLLFVPQALAAADPDKIAAAASQRLQTLANKTVQSGGKIYDKAYATGERLFSRGEIRPEVYIRLAGSAASRIAKLKTKAERSADKIVAQAIKKLQKAGGADAQIAQLNALRAQLGQQGDQLFQQTLNQIQADLEGVLDAIG